VLSRQTPLMLLLLNTVRGDDNDATTDALRRLIGGIR